VVRTSAHRLLPAVLLAALSTGCPDLGDTFQPEPQAEFSATSLDFGTILVGQSATRTLTIRNRGTGTLGGSASLTGAGYEFVSGGGAFAVTPGDLRNIVIRLTPSAVGSFPGTLDLGPDSPQVALGGAGALQAAGAQCVVLPTTVDFGFVETGQSANGSFQVYSVGTAPLIIDVVSNAPDVQVLAGGGAAVLDPGTSRAVTLAFNPQSGGLVAGIVVVGAGCSEVSVQGVGVTVSFVNDVRPIFSAYGCLNCHAFSQASSIVNVPSTGYGADYVEPFDLTRSVIYGKITNSGQFGPPMPPGGPLVQDRHRDTIRAWILEGALDN